MSAHNGLGYIARLMGQWIGRLNLNRIRMMDGEEGRYVLKKRCWFTPMVLAGGNLYIRIFRLYIRLLHQRAWLRHEKEVYQTLYGEEVEVDAKGWLKVPCIGDALWLILPDPDIEPSEKFRALQAAAADLRRIHGMRIEDEAETRLFSHGDAAVRNVAWSPEQNKAHWFDFEIKHPFGLAADWRQGDDLRAFLFSGLSLLPASDWPEAVDCVIKSYEAKPALLALRDRIASGSLELDTYHLAQMRLSRQTHENMIRLLLEKLGGI